MVLDNGAELRGLALDLRELGAELRGLDLRGGELGAHLVELLAKVQSFAPPPKGIIAGGLDLAGLCGDGCGLAGGKRDQGGPELPGLAVQLDGERHPFRLWGMPLDRRRTRKAGGVLDRAPCNVKRKVRAELIDRGGWYAPSVTVGGAMLVCPRQAACGKVAANGAGVAPGGLCGLVNGVVSRLHGGPVRLSWRCPSCPVTAGRRLGLSTLHGCPVFALPAVP